jgi:RHH-type proline utilization regulon transcriptional repressor/proline dehydrogenase/delta 1-pyrroline-5-carboxylate dehydrogenase
MAGRAGPHSPPQADGSAGEGAYWDSEIKVAQVGGYDDYPVFTRKVATDVSYLSCAHVLLGAPDCIYPAFATHNATTIGAIKALAGTTPFEFQRLHGMGEELFEGLAKLERELEVPQDAGAHLCAGRQPQGAARLPRPPASREWREQLVREPHRGR